MIPHHYEKGSEMELFLDYFDAYKKSTRWEIVRATYTNSMLPICGFLWFITVAFVATWVYALFNQHQSWMLYVAALLAFLQGFSFQAALKNAFTIEYLRHDRELKFFQTNYQYLRYLHFANRVDTNINPLKIDQTISHIEGLLETTPISRLSSSLAIIIPLTVGCSILGSSVTKWEPWVTNVVLIGIAIFLFLFIFTASLSTNLENQLREFKLFLLWKKEN
ncbi:hypothetical protein ACIPEN_18735 [Herbaspirillum chlorophenolicum]|uniref:Uncharacterized protein n=1 Tax=Herbaspirillum chlorophenolicum TaxID=211589 RepID=A0ABW8F3I2_9BURK